MLAETAKNVVDVLSEKERKRLFKMLGVPEPVKVKTKKRLFPDFTESVATEYLLNLYKKKH